MAEHIYILFCFSERFPHREIPWNLGIPDASSHGKKH